MDLVDCAKYRLGSVRLEVAIDGENRILYAGTNTVESG